MASPATTSPSAAARWKWSLSISTVIVVTVALRRWAVAGRERTSLWPDESAQLAIARWVGGGTHWEMHNHSTWRPGFATILGLLTGDGSDPAHVVRTALWINTVCWAIAAVLLFAIGRRLTALGPWQLGLVVAAVMTMPALVFTTGFVWSESLIGVIYLAALLAMLRFVESPTLGRGAALVLLSAAGFMTHSRLLTLTLFTLVLALWALRAERVDPARFGAIAVGMFAAAFGVLRYSQFVVGELWNEPSSINTADSVLERLARVGDVLVSAAGQFWYVLIASAGLALWGLLTLVQRAIDRGDAPSITPIAARVVLAVSLAQMGLSIVFLAGRERPDRIVYGRYNDSVIAPLVLIGFGTLLRGKIGWKSVAGAFGLIGVCTAVVRGFRGEVLAGGNGLEPMIFAVQGYETGGPDIPVVKIALLAAGLTVVVAGLGYLASRRAWFGVGLWAAVAAMLVVATIGANRSVERGWSGTLGIDAVAALSDGPLAGTDSIDYYLPPGNNATGRMMVYQQYLPTIGFTVVDDPLERVNGDLVFAARDHPELLDANAEVLWQDPVVDVDLYRR